MGLSLILGLCYKEEIPSTRGDFQWDETDPHQVAKSKCPIPHLYSPEPFAYRKWLVYHSPLLLISQNVAQSWGEYYIFQHLPTLWGHKLGWSQCWKLCRSHWNNWDAHELSQHWSHSKWAFFFFNFQLVTTDHMVLDCTSSCWQET